MIRQNDLKAIDQKIKLDDDQIPMVSETNSNGTLIVQLFKQIITNLK